MAAPDDTTPTPLTDERLEKQRERSRQNSRRYYYRHFDANREKRLAQKSAYYQRYKQQIAAKRRAYAGAHREEKRRVDAARYRRTSDKRILQSHMYYHTNKDIVLSKQKEYYEINKERINRRGRLSYQRNRLKHLETAKVYRRLHQELFRQIRARYRARRAQAPINDLTLAQWREIQASQNHCCAYCGTSCKGRLTQDHITPLSQGGPHTVSNVIAACQSCNSRKLTGPPLKQVQPLLLTLAPSKRKKA